jgi:hypothetical protein
MNHFGFVEGIEKRGILLIEPRRVEGHVGDDWVKCQWYVQKLAVVAVNILETGLQIHVIALACLGLAAATRPPSHNLRAGRLLSTSQTGEYISQHRCTPKAHQVM